MAIIHSDGKILSSLTLADILSLPDELGLLNVKVTQTTNPKDLQGQI